MIVICEECGKKYRIDEEKINSDKASLRCPECGNIMNITKPGPQAKRGSSSENPEASASNPKTEADKKERKKKNKEEKRKVKSVSGKKTFRPGKISIGVKLLGMFLIFTLLSASFLTFVYLKYVPSLMSKQINLRTYSLCHTFGAAVIEPLRLRNHLRVNKIAEIYVKVPGVAYVSVAHKNDGIVSGIFDNVKLKRFSPDFITKIKKEGFPKGLPLRNNLPKGKNKSAKDLIVGGQKIHDVAALIGRNGGEAHIGVFTEDAEMEIRNSLKPLLTIMVATAILGSLFFYLIARTISNPIKALTDAAQKISLGEIDLPINVKGGGEIADLAASLERMRVSVQAALDRLRRR
ncbi:MAG: zinc-ribbon domain-containing protein [Deltaproteobacteria bacterium]|nr:zinc-ribbon domain-containing protein [Deltaproteobacteria bacterium]